MVLAGAVTFSPPLACEKLKRLIRWPMLFVCVTEESRTQVTLVMLVALGVPTKKVWPYPTLVGAELIVGRAPLNRYGGEYTSAVAPPKSPPPETTRPSGRRSAVAW